MKSIFVLFNIVFILLLLMFSISIQAQKIVGKWDFSITGEIAEFTEEGVFRVKSDDLIYSYGIYHLGNDVLTVEFMDFEGVFPFPVAKLDSKEITIIHPQDGERLVYTYLGKQTVSPDEIDMVLKVMRPTEYTSDFISGEENTTMNDSQPNTLTSDLVTHHQVLQERTASLTFLQSAAIFGTWHAEDVTSTSTLILTPDYHFVRKEWASEMLRDIYPGPVVSYGRYSFDGQALTLITFDEGVSDRCEVIQIAEVTVDELIMSFDLSGRPCYLEWTYQGVAKLSDEDQTAVLAGANFFKLIGQ